jgi:hypothetical protein
MHLEKFGDSYDVVKRWLISVLKEFGPWSAHPMFTHAVSKEEAEMFSQFLGARLISTEVLTGRKSRKQFFEPCETERNLFVDPDTGICADFEYHSKKPKQIL